MPFLRPYAFRFPYDIRTTWAAMRKKFMATGGFVDPEYETMLNRLGDRDRELEDYLNGEVAQGLLALGFAPVGSQALTTTDTVVTGMSVTFTIPANRLIRITGRIVNLHQLGPDNMATFANIYLDGVRVSMNYFNHGAAGTTAGVFPFVTYYYGRSLAPGDHVAELRVSKALNLSTYATETLSDAASFIIVEDIGPDQRV